MVASGTKTHLSLSPNEARVIGSLLASTLEPGVDRVRTTGLPLSTYRDAKRRIYASGLVADRFVPDPRALGFRRISFVLTRPLTTEMSARAESLCHTPGIAVAWACSQVLFGVVFHSSEAQSEAFLREVREGNLGTPLSLLDVDPTLALVPVYFDFEAAWNRFVGLSGSQSYPRPLPSAQGRRKSPELNPSFLQKRLLPLLSRPHLGRPPHLAGPDTVPRSQRRLLESGLVEWRVFLSLGVVPHYRGASISDVLLVRGSLRDPQGLPSLLADLTGQCGVSPFLLASDGTQVILGSLALGQVPTTEPPRFQPRQPVLPMMTRHLEDVDMVREPLLRIRELCAHRYDLLKGS